MEQVIIIWNDVTLFFNNYNLLMKIIYLYLILMAVVIYKIHTNIGIIGTSYWILKTVFIVIQRNNKYFL